MPMTGPQKRKLVEDVLRDHLPWNGEGSDPRDLAVLRKQLERNVVNGLIRTFRRKQAEEALEEVDVGDIN